MNPEILYGGLAAERTYNLSNYSTANGWSLKARLIHSGGSVDITTENANGSGTVWTLLIPAATFDNVPSGKVSLQLIAFDGSTEQSALVERLDFFTAAETDLRTTAQIQLEAIEAVLENKATQDQSSVSYNGRSISRMSWDDLQNAADRLRRQIKRETDRASGKGRIQSVGLRFTDA